MSEEPSQAWSPPEEASPVPPSEPASSNADVHRRAEVEAETVRLPGLTERQEQLRRNPAAFTPGEDCSADRLLGTTVPAAETVVPTRNERPTGLVTGQGGSEERRPEQQRDPAVPTTPPSALPPELASHEPETRAVEEQSQDPGEIALDAKMGPRQGGPHATSDFKEMEERLQQWHIARDETRNKEWDRKLNVLRVETQQQRKLALQAAVDRENKLEQRIAAAEDHEDKLQQMIVKLEAENDQLRKGIEELTKKNAKVERERRLQRNRMAIDLREVEKKWKDKKDAEIRALGEAKDAEIKALREEKDAEIRALGEAKDAKIKALREEVRRLAAEKDHLETERDQLKEDLERLTADSNEERQDGPQGSPPPYGALFPHPENGSASGPSVPVASFPGRTIWREPRQETPPPSPPSDPQQDGEDNTFSESDGNPYNGILR